MAEGLIILGLFLVLGFVALIVMLWIVESNDRRCLLEAQEQKKKHAKKIAAKAKPKPAPPPLPAEPPPQNMYDHLHRGYREYWIRKTS